MSDTDRCPNFPRCSGDCPVSQCELDEHFRGCHPEDVEDPREVPEGYEPQETENCWHCGTPASRGVCSCAECWESDYIPPSAIYHCPACGRWWAWMTGLNITTITFGAGEGQPGA